MLTDFKERGREGEIEEEKYQLVAFPTCPKQGLTPQPGYVTWTGNQPKIFMFVGRHQPTEPHRPGHRVEFFKIVYWLLLIIRQYLLTKVKSKPKGVRDFDQKSRVIIRHYE